ncbi:ankyrin repeat domain-containing protein [Falsirhodobacter sp. alg1]|uniref:ankyrin repeat domain-containing protein n=1 Tax=Falsirhodobacter sp. alg1 TaxID=1472418 RepID=UPI0006941E2C|nr:ankyrin repeat domain-containing protein [Falsirhodobacter sp. alg1]
MRGLLTLLSSMFLGTTPRDKTWPHEDDIRSFHTMVSLGDVKAVQKALDANPALATSTDQFLFQPIHLVCDVDHYPLIPLLLRYGADINAVNEDGHSLLHITNDPDLVPLIVAAGADLELRDLQGRTPLLVALTEPDIYDVVDALLESGSDPNARDRRGRSVLDYAHADGTDEDLLDLLMDAGAE